MLRFSHRFLAFWLSLGLCGDSGLAQVFAALSYYSDHQEEINAYIERNHIPPELIHPLVKDL